jgi:protein TonB
LIARFGAALTSGIVMTFALLWLMQFLIVTGKDVLTDSGDFRLADFIRVRQEETVEQKDRKPPKPPPVEEKPPEMPPPELDSLDPNAPQVNLGRVRMNMDIGIGGSSFHVDGEYLPIVRVEPLYPRRAQSRGLEGFCDVEFTVTKTGEVVDAIAIECSSSVFRSTSEKAVLKWKYKARVVNGVPIDSPGVVTRLTYRFEE